MIKKICSLFIILSIVSCYFTAAAKSGEFKELYISENFETSTGAFKGHEKTEGEVVNTVSRITSGGNTYLRLKKNTDSSDCFADVNIGRTFKKTVVEFDFKISAKGVSGMLAYVSDYTSGSLQSDSLINLSKDGKISGKSGSYQLSENNWVHIEVLLDLENKKYTVSVNGDKIENNTVYSVRDIHSLDLYRIYAGSGKGDMCIDNFKAYSGESVRDVSGETATGGRKYIFESNYHTKSVLRTRSAVCVRNGVKYFKGGKANCDKQPFIDNDEMYLSSSDFADITGCAVSETDNGFVIGGEVFYKNSYKSTLGELDRPVKDEFLPFGEVARLLNIKYYCAKGAVYIVSGSDMTESEIDEVLRFMTFERPGADVLMSSFSGTHPYVMINGEKVNSLKNSQDTTFLSYKNEAIKKADKILSQNYLPVYNIEDGLRLLPVCSGTEYSLSYLSFAYLMTGDKKYSDGAWRIAKAVCSFPDWNADRHFLDTGVMLSAIAIYYDWCSGAMTENQKRTVYNASKKFAFEKAKSAYYGTNASFNTFFATTDTNWSSVCNGSLAVAAMAMMENDPSYLSDITENAMRALEYSVSSAFPDGSWKEGIGYWAWYLQHLARFMSTYENVYGKSIYLDCPGMDKFGYFGQNMSSDVGINNFHDSDNTFFAPGAMLYLGEKYGDENLVNTKFAFADKYNVSLDIDTLCFYTPKSGGEIPDCDGYYRDTETVFAKSNSDMFFSFHGGDNSGAHSHYDSGAYIYDINGVRWVSDIGKRDYNITSELGKSGLYHIRAEGHNTLIINPSEDAGQTENGFASVVRYEKSDKSMVAILDMTQQYTDANSVLRGFFIGDNRKSVTVRDEVDLKESGTVYSFIHTEANAVKNDDNSFTLTKNGKSVKIVFSSNVPLEAYVGEAQPLNSFGGKIKAIDTDSFKRLVLKASGSGKINIAVKLFPLGEGIDENISDTPVSLWKAENSINTFDSGEYNALFGKKDGDRCIGGECVTLPINSKRKDLSEQISFYAAFNDKKYIELVGKKNLSDNEEILGRLLECVNGDAYVFGKKAGELRIVKNKWYKIDALIKSGDKNTVTLYVDNKLYADNIEFLSGETIEELCAVNLYDAFADNLFADREDSVNILPLTFISKDKNIRKYTVTDKGFLMYCDKKSDITQSVISAFGKKNIKKAELFGDYIIITTSSADKIYMPVCDLGELIYHGTEKKMSLSSSYPTTVKISLDNSDNAVIKLGENTISVSGEDVTVNSVTYRAEKASSIAVSVYPQLKSMDIYVNGRLISGNCQYIGSELDGWDITGEISDILCYTGGFYCDMRASASDGKFVGKSVYDRDITVVMADYDAYKMTGAELFKAHITSSENEYAIKQAQRYFLLDDLNSLKPIRY